MKQDAEKVDENGMGKHRLTADERQDLDRRVIGALRAGIKALRQAHKLDIAQVGSQYRAKIKQLQDEIRRLKKRRR